MEIVYYGTLHAILTWMIRMIALKGAIQRVTSSPEADHVLSGSDFRTSYRYPGGTL